MQNAIWQFFLNKTVNSCTAREKGLAIKPEAIFCQESSEIVLN